MPSRKRSARAKYDLSFKLTLPRSLLFTLVDLDLDSSLTVSRSRERLQLLGRDGVAVDKLRHDTTKGLDTGEWPGGNVEEQDVSDTAGENATLNGGSNGSRLIRVNTLARLPSEDILYGLADLRRTSHTTDQDDFINFMGLHAGIIKCLLAGLDSALDEFVDKALEVGSAELRVDMLGT